MEEDQLYLNKSTALLIWNSEVENDAHVYLGQIKREGADFVFKNELKRWELSLDPEKLERLKPVTAELKEIFLGADYFISLSMTGLPEDPGQDFVPTGFGWH